MYKARLQKNDTYTKEKKSCLTFFPGKSKFLVVLLAEVIASVKAAVNIEQIVIPASIQKMENARPVIDFGALSP